MNDYKKIKHFSFDLWFTLIKSNPEFKKQRAKYFYKHFNSLHKSLLEVETSFRHVDLMCNAINQKTGKSISSEEMYLMVIFQLNDSLEPYKNLDIISLYKDIEKLVFKYYPTLYDLQTKSTLDCIKQNSFTTLNILSNTAFIKGSTLKIILDQLELSPYFNFQIYSDEVGVSKPNGEMYEILLNQIYSTRLNDHILLSEIIHIGDNQVADYEGAKSCGIQALQINTNQISISQILN